MSNLIKRGNTWYARFQIDGHKYQQSLRTANKRVAEARCKEIMAKAKAAIYFGDDRRTFQESAVKWASEYLPGNVKPGTAKRYLCSLKALDPHFGKHYVDQINKKAITEYISARRVHGASNATIRRDLTALSSILTVAEQEGWIEDNAARRYDRRTVKERRDPIQPPTDEEVNATIAITTNHNARSLIRFLEQTGARLGEATFLEWPQVDLKTRTVQLYKTKNSRARVVPLSEEAVATITVTPRHLKSKYVFWHDEGEPFRYFSSQFGKLTAKAGRPFRAHDLRHKFAIDYLNSGGDIYDLSRILGHSSVKVTEIYLGYTKNTVVTKTVATPTV